MEAFQNLTDPRAGKAKRHYFGEVLFTAHVRSIRADLAGCLIAIGGKTVRHSFKDGDPSNSIHLASARADGYGLTLGQLLVEGKDKEIIAVPRLLRQLDLAGTTVSLDDMGCQKKIAQEIHFAGAHYILALKGNHGTLHADVAALFGDPAALAYCCSKGAVVGDHDPGFEKGHGRIEGRAVRVTDYLDGFDPS